MIFARRGKHTRKSKSAVQDSTVQDLTEDSPRDSQRSAEMATGNIAVEGDDIDPYAFHSSDDEKAPKVAQQRGE